MVVEHINRGESPQPVAGTRYSGMIDRTWPGAEAGYYAR